jgi:hypothetical protein
MHKSLAAMNHPLDMNFQAELFATANGEGGRRSVVLDKKL